MVDALAHAVKKNGAAHRYVRRITESRDASILRNGFERRQTALGPCPCAACPPVLPRTCVTRRFQTDPVGVGPQLLGACVSPQHRPASQGAGLCSVRPCPHRHERPSSNNSDRPPSSRVCARMHEVWVCPPCGSARDHWGGLPTHHHRA